MPEVWSDEITERSWQTLLNLNRKWNFVLIGGWAAWIHGRAAKSRDIDLIVTYDELSRMRNELPITKNDRLSKYEVKADLFDIDIYVPHFSRTLSLPPEYVMEHTEEREGFTVPTVEILLGLKLGAWKDRQHTPKGYKDLVDISGLMRLTDRQAFAAALPPDRRPRLLDVFDEATVAIRRDRRLHHLRRDGLSR